MSLPLHKIPDTESLKDTYDRVVPYYKEIIKPQISLGKKILVAAHGNSLRALCKDLFNISNSKINNLEIPTGNPLCIEFKNNYSEVFNAFYLDKKREEHLFFNK